MDLIFIQPYYSKRLRNGAAEATSCHLTFGILGEGTGGGGLRASGGWQPLRF